MQFLTDIKAIFFPNICLSCKSILTSNEDAICTICLYELPMTNFTLNKSDDILKIFYGRIDLNNATALLYFQKKGLVQQLIHGLKYHGQERIGYIFGNWLGAEMLKSNMYADIDFVIPVPLHKKRLKKRGYNQVTKFGQQLAASLNTIYLPEVLVRKTATKTQTKKIRFDRWNNVNEIFQLLDVSLFENKNILLVDDIITTGATIEACYEVLIEAKNIKVSVAVMAISYY